MARRLFPKPIHAKEEKNSPSSANQGPSTAMTKCGLHVTQPTSSCPCSHRTHLQGTCWKWYHCRYATFTWHFDAIPRDTCTISPKIACPSLKQPLNLLVLHQLISCQEALAQGWCIWRGDLVLNCLVSKGVTHKLSTCVLTSSRGGSYHNSYYCQLKHSPLRVPLPHVHMQWQGKQLQISRRLLTILIQ